MSELFYTPSLEEFHFGFEYEIFEDFDFYAEPTWHKQVYGKDGADPEKIGYVHFDMSNFRVPFLTKEDIEAEGFPYIEGNGMTNWFRVGIGKTSWTDNVQDYFRYTPYSFQITFFKKTHLLSVGIDFDGCGTEFQTMFEGECKSLSRFRQILDWTKIKPLKQLGI